MSITPLWQQHLERCKHFTGLMHDECEAGVRYLDVREARTPGPAIFPCLKRHGDHSTLCALATFPTEEEAREYERETEEYLRQSFEKLASNICPHCDTPITRKRQVGSCVYADPCGHRLYQGRLTAAEKAAQA